MRWLAACGVLTSVLDVLITIGLSALDPDYSHSRQYISELGETGRAYAEVFNAWCAVYGVLFSGFAVALGSGLKSRLVLISLLVIAVSSAGAGAFPCDPGCAGESVAARVHILFGYAGLAGIILAPFLAGHAMAGKVAWRGYRALSLASGALLIVGTGWLAVSHYVGRRQYECEGAAQRVIVGVLYVWMVTVAVRLWQLAGKPSTGKNRREAAA